MKNIKTLLVSIFLVVVSGCQELINISIYDDSSLSFKLNKNYRICKIELYSGSLDGEEFIINYSNPIWMSKAHGDCSKQPKIKEFTTSVPPASHDVLIDKFNLANLNQEPRFYELLMDGVEGKSGGLRFSCKNGRCNAL